MESLLIITSVFNLVFDTNIQKTVAIQNLHNFEKKKHLCVSECTKTVCIFFPKGIICYLLSPSNAKY